MAPSHYEHMSPDLFGRGAATPYRFRTDSAEGAKVWIRQAREVLMHHGDRAFTAETQMDSLRQRHNGQVPTAGDVDGSLTARHPCERGVSEEVLRVAYDQGGAHARFQQLLIAFGQARVGVRLRGAGFSLEAEVRFQFAIAEFCEAAGYDPRPIASERGVQIVRIQVTRHHPSTQNHGVYLPRLSW